MKYVYYLYMYLVFTYTFPFKQGNSCKSTCKTCTNNTCIECNDGFFLRGGMCMRCHGNCRTCSDGDVCDTCLVGYWGLTCFNVCSEGCVECNKDNGDCTACRLGYYGPYCKQTCPRRCIGVPAVLPVCDINMGTCNACQPGYYGHECDLVCPPACSGCHKNGTCLHCQHRYMYGDNCTLQCSSLCINGTCDRWTGECPLNCVSRCKTCDHSTRKCVKCMETMSYGDKCQYQCNAYCANQTCDFTSGECFACDDGYFGPFCNVSCSVTCKNNQCDRRGECTSGCITNHYGANCRMMCSNNCKSTTTGVLCDDKGKCLKGCVRGYTGDDCRTGM